MTITTSHQRSILKIQKPVEVPIFYLLVVFLSKSLNSVSFPSPFTVNLIREADDELQPVGHHSGRQLRPRR